MIFGCSQQQFMYNSFIFKKQSVGNNDQQSKNRKDKKWKANYNNNVRPVLLQKYNRRINNFVVKLQQDKTQLAQFRKQTQAKASHLLKQIQYKERFLGQPNIKLRDCRDWNSILTTTDRIQKQKNKSLFADKFGNQDIAFRSIASQSAYTSSGSTNFRTRNKNKQIHSHNMRFSYRPRTFSQNKRENKSKTSKSVASIHEDIAGQQLRRTKSKGSAQDLQLIRTKTNKTNSSIAQQQHRSRVMSMFSWAGMEKQDNQQSVSNHKEHIPMHLRDTTTNNKKIYFKQMVDLQQNCIEPNVKKTLHQILVRFGITKIKDVKKQAMVETDILQSDDF